MLDKNKVKLGIAPIALTNDDMPDLGRENTFEQCVSEMALAGFTGSEVGGKYPADPAVLKAALDIRGIHRPSHIFLPRRAGLSSPGYYNSALILRSPLPPSL